VTPARRKVSLVAEFLTLSCPYKVMLRKLELKARRKIHVVGSAVNNTTTEIHFSFDTGHGVLSALHGSMRVRWCWRYERIIFGKYM
jgi:hypothetical protein